MKVVCSRINLVMRFCLAFLWAHATAGLAFAFVDFDFKWKNIVFTTECLESSRQIKYPADVKVLEYDLS